MRRLLAVAACLAVAGVAAPFVLAGGPLATGLVATADFSGPDADLAYARAREAGALFIRITASWPQIAPNAPAKGSNARDPNNPAYDWSALDTAVKLARTNKLLPIVDVGGAPRWAWGRASTSEPGQGPIRPSLTALAGFTAAAAERYSGRSPGLPRVKHWQLWNEPNLTTYLRPQFEGDRVVSASWYRAMTNVFYKSVHAAQGNNVVIAGALSPFTVENDGYVSVGPLRFMRELLCMSADERPQPTCARKTQFDIWAHHPYTSGGPTHEALNPDDVSLGDLPEMKRLLDAAVKAGHVVSNQKMRFWVTEFSWDTSPPDPQGLRFALHARWVSEALYRSWQAGVSMFTWFALRDEPNKPPYFCQCGLHLRGKTIAQDKPKPALQAFRFPFVAFSQPNATVTFWGRTPASDAKTLLIEQSGAGGWKQVATVLSNRNGIFQGTYASSAKTGFVRARIVGGGAGDTARPFGLRVPPDRTFCAFGSC